MIGELFSAARTVPHGLKFKTTSDADMKKNCFAAILFLSFAFSCALAAKEKAKPEPIKSIAVSEYTGDEEKPVTLPAGFKLSREAVMKNVDDKTAVIIIYNGTGRDLSYFQLKLERPGTGEWAGYSVKGYHGYGALLKGEKRIIKLKDQAAFSAIKLGWSSGKWSFGSARFHYRYFKGGLPHLFTLTKEKAIHPMKQKNGDHGNATWKEWGK